MDDESHRFKTNTIITVDDQTQRTGCTPPPGHHGWRGSPPGPAILHSLQRVGTAQPAARDITVGFLVGERLEELCLVVRPRKSS
jgi:hypothetical protein